MATQINSVNYAKVYNEALAQEWPYVLNFGALYATPNNGRYRFTGGKTIEIPVIKTTGRVASSRDANEACARNYENSWETKVLTNQRRWSTLIHPQDIDQTNAAANISNITSVFNTEHKFPEMDAYTCSKIYTDWTALGHTAKTDEITAENILSVFDELMEAMSEKRVPVSGRILYLTPDLMNMLKNSAAINRTFDVQNSEGNLNRRITTLDGVSIIEVPAELMKTAYDFTEGFEPTGSAKQIKMLLIHPESVITPVSYEYAQLDEPSAASGGKYVYFEESYEDVFILNNRADGIAFVTEA